MKFTFLLIIVILAGTLALAGCQTASTPTANSAPPAPLANTASPSATDTLTSTVPESTSAATPTVSADSPTPITVTDDIGRSVIFKSPPQRIISLAPSNTELVYALGLQDRLIGVTTYDNYPPEVKDKPQVSDFSNVDVEKVVALHPDLILAADIQKADVVPALEKLGINVIVFDPVTVEGVFNDLTLLGEISGKSQQAAALVASLSQRVKAITDKVSVAGAPYPRILYVTWYDPIWTAGDNTMIGDLFKKVGATNIAADVSGYGTISLENVIQRNPQIIVVMSSMGDQNQSLNWVNTEPRLKATDALKNQQVYEINSDIFGRTTPRIVDGLEQLAKIVHPDLFK